jgi:hypothetical protein
MKIFVVLTIVFIIFTFPLRQAYLQQNPAAFINNVGGKIPAPATGKMYHGIHIGGDKGEEDIIFIKPKAINSYIGVTGKNRKPFFVYFSQEWGEEGEGKPDFRKLPKTAIDEVMKRGGIPFIRLMLRSSLASLENAKQKVAGSNFSRWKISLAGARTKLNPLTSGAEKYTGKLILPSKSGERRRGNTGNL